MELQDRYAPVRVAREVLGPARLTGEEIDGHALVVEAQVGEQDAHLQAVRGRRVVVEDHSVFRRCAIVSANARSVAEGSKRGPTSRPNACSVSISVNVKRVPAASSPSRIVWRPANGVCGSR